MRRAYHYSMTRAESDQPAGRIEGVDIMGFGNGYSHKSDNGGKRYSNSQTAHVWAQGDETSVGQSSNGNLFFRRNTLYSYGTHFVVGYIMPDGVAFMNADSYSVSTSGHQSDASAAIRHRDNVSVASLTDIASNSWELLPTIARHVVEGGATSSEWKAGIRKQLLAHAEALESRIYAAGASRYDWDSEAGRSVRIEGGEEAGAYLARLAGLPAASWPKAKRDAATLRAKATARKAKADRDAAESRALRLADMNGKRWREYIAELGAGYLPDASFKSLALELHRARKLALAATSGKLASKARLATLRARLAQARAEVETAGERREGRERRARLASYLADVRNWRDASPAGRLTVTNYHGMLNLERAADWLAEFGRTSALKASAAEFARLARIGREAISAEDRRRAELERVNREAALIERRKAWLAGQSVGAVRFDADSGGAAMRIVGDTLETSHGASVPLAHAVKAFRFVKMMRERGTSWRRNGKTIRVGHFQVDYIDADGDFRAGCHSFTWPEVERVAKLAGVFDCSASDAAVEPSAVAA